jgi:hypothetical protein
MDASWLCHRKGRNNETIFLSSNLPDNIGKISACYTERERVRERKCEVNKGG